MTMANDTPMLELLAATEQLAEGYARSLRAVQDVTTACLEGRRLPDAALEA